jgi:Protein of unknown function (DUF2867)
MQIEKVPFPRNSMIRDSFPVIDYSDCFRSKFITDFDIRLEHCIQSFLFNTPKWSVALMKLRNLLVKPFGLKTGTDQDKKNIPVMINLAKGDKIAFFEVIACFDDEVLLYITDKHMDACLSVMLKKPDHGTYLHNAKNEYQVFVTTAVKFKNTFGHIYFFFIKPFHTLLMRNMIYRFIQKFNSL